MGTSSELQIVAVLSIVDTREYELVAGENGRERSVPIPGSGVTRECDRCGRAHEVHALVELSDGSQRMMGTGCAQKHTPKIARALSTAVNAERTLRELQCAQHALCMLLAKNAAIGALVEAMLAPPIEQLANRNGHRRFAMGDVATNSFDDNEHMDAIRARLHAAWGCRRLYALGWVSTTSLERSVAALQARLARR